MSQDPSKKSTLKDKINGFSQWARDHKGTAFMFAVIVAAMFIFVNVTIERNFSPVPEEVTYSQFESAMDSGTVLNVAYNTHDQQIYGTWDPDGDGVTTAFTTPYSSAGYDNLKEFLGKHPSVKFQAETVSRQGFSTVQTGCIVVIGVCAMLIFVSGKIREEDDESRSMFGSGSKVDGVKKGKKGKKAPVEKSECPNVRFSDIAGCDEALEEVAEVKEFLTNPKKFTRLGAKIPCGILMAGPPGCGKTLMAKAIAGESGASFFTVSGSDFVEMFVGVGANRVRELFASARENTPAIVFIDEIDAVGKKRASNSQLGDSEMDRTLNQLLVEMDGFSESDNIVVIGATNRIDTLDPALLRPGRFDRHVTVDLPDKGGRREILSVHSKNKPLTEDVDMDHYATITAGMSGAQLANLMNEAAIFAARDDADAIYNVHMNAAFERIVAGAEKKGRVLSEDEKRTTAYHEAGHAIVGHMLEGAEKVSKISIVSRGQSLGYTLTLPENDTFLHKRQHLKNKLAMFLGGLVAEEMVNDYDISTGPSNDLERATKTATAMATKFGMCDELGRRAFIDDEQSFSRSYSEQKGQEIDAAVDALMKEAHDSALAILTEHRDRLDQIAEVLVAQEVVEGQEMEDLLDGCWKGFGAYEKTEPERTYGRMGAESQEEAEGGESGDDADHKRGGRERELVADVVDNAKSITDKFRKKKKEPQRS